MLCVQGFLTCPERVAVKQLHKQLVWAAMQHKTSVADLLADPQENGLEQSAGCLWAGSGQVDHSCHH